MQKKILNVPTLITTIKDTQYKWFSYSGFKKESLPLDYYCKMSSRNKLSPNVFL